MKQWLEKCSCHLYLFYKFIFKWDFYFFYNKYKITSIFLIGISTEVLPQSFKSVLKTAPCTVHEI